MEHNFRTLARDARHALILIARSIDAHSPSTNTEHDVLEMINITNTVCNQRFAFSGVIAGDVELVAPGVQPERKGDDDFSSLFDSVRLDAVDSVRAAFVGEKNRSGPVAQRFVTIGLDHIFDLLSKVPPHRAPALMQALTKAAYRDICTLQEYDPIDAKVAAGTISKMIKARSPRKQKAISKEDRLKMIITASEKLQDSA